MSFKISDKEKRVGDVENELISLVDENSAGSQDLLNASGDNIQYLRNENDIVSYRLLHFEDSEPNKNSNTSASTASNMSQPCQVYVIGNASNFLQAQRHTTQKSDVISPIQHTNVRKRDERRRATHNEVERRRRDKINSWILKLSKIIPPDPTEVPRNGCSNLEGQSKGGILAKACEYITELKETNASLKTYEAELVKLAEENKLLLEKNQSLIAENEILKAQLSGVKIEMDAKKL